MPSRTKSFIAVAIYLLAMGIVGHMEMMPY